MKQEIKAVMFDLDGTLLNTLDDLTAAVNYALSERGYPGRTRDEVCAAVGNGIGKLIERSVPAGTAPEEVADALRDFTAYYEAHLSVYTRPYPGIIELLKRLLARGIRVGVVSNKKDEAARALCREVFGDEVLVVGERADVRAAERVGAGEKNGGAVCRRLRRGCGDRRGHGASLHLRHVGISHPGGACRRRCDRVYR